MEERFYTLEEAELLKNKYVKCDDAECDGSLCGYLHNKIHIYDDVECFHSCCHIGRSGFCVETE